MDGGEEADINAHLQRVLASEGFAKSATNCRLLSYLVQRHLQGAEPPKEADIAIDVFNRTASFHGGDDSVVRVAMRGMRQKLVEYYAGPGKNERQQLDVPKGSYRLRVVARGEGVLLPEPVFDVPAELALPPAAPRRPWLAVTLGVLAISLAVNAFLLWQQRQTDHGAELAQVRGSALWHAVVDSERPVMFVLGDIFMYTQTDPVTGHTQTVRDPQISSSEDLRAFIASNPALASVRGLRYASYLQKSTAVGLATVLPIVARPGRDIEVRLRDELRTEDFSRYDIVYIGPLTRLGPLDAAVQKISQYRFDAATSGVADTQSGKVFVPEGGLGDHRKDFALVSRFLGPEGSQVVVITAGGRNAGLTQVVRTVTTPEGLAAFDKAVLGLDAQVQGAFQAVLEVAGYRQTDLSAQLVELRGLAAAPVPASKRISAVATLRP